MNEAISPTSTSAEQRLSRTAAMHVPDTSMLPAAETALRKRAGRLADGHHEQDAGWRNTVRRHPLAALFSAALMGAVIARFSR